MEDKLLRRAGLDYHEFADVRRHARWEDYAATVDAARCFAFSTRGTGTLASVDWRAGDSLVFGSESAGLPAALRDAFPPERLVRLPLLPGQRSLNLSNAVAVAVFEAWRVNGYAGSV